MLPCISKRNLEGFCRQSRILGCAQEIRVPVCGEAHLDDRHIKILESGGEMRPLDNGGESMQGMSTDLCG